MTQFNFETFQQAFNPVKFIDQAEKNTQALLAYVVPKELSQTLLSLTSAQANFARANLEALKGVESVVKSTAEQFTKNFEKATASK